MNYKELEKRLNKIANKHVEIDAKDVYLSIFIDDVKFAEINNNRSICFRDLDSEEFFGIPISIVEELVQFVSMNDFGEMTNVSKTINMTKSQALITDTAYQRLIQQYDRYIDVDLTELEKNDIKAVRKQLENNFDLHDVEDYK